MMKNTDKTTGTLTRVLRTADPEQLGSWLEENRQELIQGERPFARFMRQCIREKGMQQQEVFIRADLSESYGYKLISEEKRTAQRDTVLRLCFGARLTLEETQRALRIYGFSPLYPRIPRDAVMLSALGRGISDIAEINALLLQNQLPPLRGTDI